jgi:hypothetical protein
MIYCYTKTQRKKVKIDFPWDIEEKKTINSINDEKILFKKI